MEKYRTLRELLLETLREREVYSVGVKVILSRSELARQGFQRIALEILLNDAVICDEHVFGEVFKTETISSQEYRIVIPPGSTRADSTLTRRLRCSKRVLVSRDNLEKLVSINVKPLFVIELGASRRRNNLGSEGLLEGIDLDVEIADALEYIRRHLWDENLVIASSSPTIVETLEKNVGYNRVVVTAKSSAEFLWGKGIERVAVITRNAYKPLTSDELYSYDAYVFPILGGDNDIKTRSLVESLVPWGKLRRIELRGSTVGVPEKLSRLLCILVRAFYDFDGDIDKAVVSCMSSRDIRRRLLREIESRAKESLMGRYVSIEDYLDIASWLPVTVQEFKRVCDLLGLKTRGI
ncbi:MAG: hypothetical protein QXS85_03490 [Acidilobaceae archaeon]